MDKVIAAEVDHSNADLFNRIFDLMEVLRNDQSFEENQDDPNGAYLQNPVS